MSSLTRSSMGGESARRWLGDRKWRLIALGVALLVAFAAMFTIVSVRSQQQAGTYQSAYKSQVSKLQTAIKKARGEGYTSQDLAPVVNRLQQVQSASEPAWIPSRPGFYQDQAATVSQLRGTLNGLLVEVLGNARASATAQINDARDAMAKAQSDGLDSISVSSVQTRLQALVSLQASAKTLPQFRNVTSQAKQLGADVQKLVQTQKQEDAAVQQAAQQLLSQNGGNIDALRNIASTGVTSGRNDASLAGYLNYGKQFKGNYDDVSLGEARLERYAPMAASADVNQVALAAAAAQRYGGQIHNAVYGQLPGKFVLVSFSAQHVWAFQGGQVAMDSAVTTGIQGVTDFGTDFGPMKVLYKVHPWTMKSPYPKGSPYWYPDTPVQWTTWFTVGESFHDADWEPDSQLGPGSQFDPSTRSHGCVHLPLNLAQWMYDWADVGTPVIVYPGDGSAPAQQLSEITTDPAGHPNNPA